MVAKTQETFMRCEAIHCFDRKSVRFATYPAGFDGPRVLAEICEDALRDLFGAQGGPDTLLEACALHFDIIEAIALERYGRKPYTGVYLRTADFLCAVEPA
jgi:hypothetical protein